VLAELSNTFVYRPTPITALVSTHCRIDWPDQTVGPGLDQTVGPGLDQTGLLTKRSQKIWDWTVRRSSL
jgi:hypothetical protein